MGMMRRPAGRLQPGPPAVLVVDALPPAIRQVRWHRHLAGMRVWPPRLLLDARAHAARAGCRCCVVSCSLRCRALAARGSLLAALAARGSGHCVWFRQSCIPCFLCGACASCRGRLQEPPLASATMGVTGARRGGMCRSTSTTWTRPSSTCRYRSSTPSS